jgi:hypothetical protein
MVNDTPHKHPEPFRGFLAALAGGACGIGLLFAGLQSLFVAALLGGVTTVGIAVYLSLGLVRPRVDAVLGWAFAFVILTWPVMVFAVAMIALATNPGD